MGDFNRDGKLDIVVGNTTANDIYFFAGAGNNTFGAGVESPSLNFPDSIAAGDFNGDGILDIVGVAPNFNAVDLTLGVGDGSFGTFPQRSAGEFPATKQPWAVAVGDFNNDGQLDIVTANTYHPVNIASPAYQARYLAEYPAIPAGNPSIDILTNASAARSTSPLLRIAAPVDNTDVTVQANVQPAYSGGTPTGSVIFENLPDQPRVPVPTPCLAAWHPMTLDTSAAVRICLPLSTPVTATSSPPTFWAASTVTVVGNTRHSYRKSGFRGLYRHHNCDRHRHRHRR